MRHWTGSSVVQIMACRLCGAKPLPAPMLTHCQLDHWKQNVTENSNRISNIVMILTTKRNCYVCNTFHLFGSCLAWMIFVHINTLRPTRNRHHFADDISNAFFNENELIPIKISLKCIPKDPFNSIPALVQIMAWRRPGDKPLSEPMMVILLTHVGVTRPQCVKGCNGQERRYKITFTTPVGRYWY